MTPTELITAIAYVIFLIGASISFLTQGGKLAIWLLTLGVLLDFLTVALPSLGVSWLKMQLAGTNSTILAGIFLGILVWLLFAAALVFRKIEKIVAFHFLVILIEVVWFVDFLLFLYGIYKFPLSPLK
ncbi:hypothetical protein Ctha_1692 [Chloroherpeton thalassium ATCC 35110]|uniref:Uncharacterized protein n=1 Tax=Chloroherpeton thalassium (strain ATCC 35110 / GB-78) TaxID=517418 RepID=B3QT50_CHLT3|nr:hypothetical protein [Chloroherpeton thalassium]ACF14149.1 hypothetical protein Ctha_1692 [Chloroherpeton thalassium ATCC 35110]